MASLGETTVCGNLHVTGQVNEGFNPLIVPGVIMMWHGTLSNIPSGWKLCDGTNGTPDLRNRFIVGSPTYTNPGTTGGSSSLTLEVANLPIHTHTATITGVGDHRHTYRYCNYTNAGAYGSDSTINTATGGTGTGSTGDHAHGITCGDAGSSTAFENRPAFYTVAFLMKT